MDIKGAFCVLLIYTRIQSRNYLVINIAFVRKTNCFLGIIPFKNKCKEKSFFNSRQDDKCICDHLDNGLELAIVEIGHLIVLHKRKMSIL